MFLHGCNNNPVYSSHWIISTLNVIEPCAVFLPTAPVTQNTEYPCADWGGTYDSKIRPQMTNALHELDSLIALYGFDTNRQYIYGESMGGEGVFRLLVDFPTRFAAAVAVAGYTLDKGADKMAQTPLWILHGADDEISPVDNDRAIYNSILDAGGTNVKYTEYPGLDHSAGIVNARTEPGLQEWLLAHQRTGIIPRSGWKGKSLIPDDLFSYRSGNLYCSSLLPRGTTLTFFDLSGQMLLKADTPVGSMRFPVGTSGRVVVWNVSHQQFSYSGKTSLYK